MDVVDEEFEAMEIETSDVDEKRSSVDQIENFEGLKEQKERVC